MSWNREKFEEELYSLQNDISQLSQKLSTSIPNTSGNSPYIMQQLLFTHPIFYHIASRRVSSAQKLVNGSQVRPIVSDEDISSQTIHYFDLIDFFQDKEGKKSSTQMKSDLIRVTHERDDALARLQHVSLYCRKKKLH